MKRVDHMINYLSGNLSREESLAFEEELSRNPQLKEEFADVSLAYRMIGDQVRRRDEEDFTAAVYAAMKKSVPAGRSLKNKRFRTWILFMAMAASAALLISIFANRDRTERIYASSYHPSDDKVIRALEGNSRGKAGRQVLIKLWKEEDYAHCRDLAARHFSEDPSDQGAMLFYLLSSMEMDDTAAVLEKLEIYETDTDEPLGQAISWYKALALLRRGKTSEALDLLSPLGEHSGPYQKDANKLKKKLKK